MYFCFTIAEISLFSCLFLFGKSLVLVEIPVLSLSDLVNFASLRLSESVASAKDYSAFKLFLTKYCIEKGINYKILKE